jgi:phenylpropionate dioxygenase-like ring-hydroxylating dioxygenase large terminal subunit
MERQRQLALLERLLSQTAAEPHWAPESSLSVDRYTSAERFDAERRILFRQHPIIIGREGDLAEPGAFLVHDATGVPILVVRDRSGTVRAMLNICRHRGSKLVSEPAGNAKAFVCRYHSWTYDLAGCLIQVPHERSCFPTLDRASAGLVELPCQVRHGFVWVTPEPKPDAGRPVRDLRAWLGEYDADLESFDLASHHVVARSHGVRAANWKLVMDAFLETYHVKALHHKTLARFFRDEVVADFCGPHSRSAGARRTLPELAAQPRAAWDLRQTATVFYALFPNTVLVFHPDTISHLALFPRALGEVEYVHTLLAPRSPAEASDAEREAWRKTWALIDGTVFEQEDFVVAERIQSVLGADRAGAAFRLGALEHQIQRFHEAIDQALAVGPIGGR